MSKDDTTKQPDSAMEDSSMEMTDDSSMKEDDSMMEEGDKMEAMEAPENALMVEAGSTVTYSAEKIVGNSHTGTVTISNGFVTQTDGKIDGGEFVLDMSSITDGGKSEMYLKHVMSADFFNVEMYPTAKLVVTNVNYTSDTTAEVTADLTIKDQTNEITFTVDLTETDSALMAKASFDIDRTRWGITYDSGSILAELGDKAIRDEITYDLDLTFNK